MDWKTIYIVCIFVLARWGSFIGAAVVLFDYTAWQAWGLVVLLGVWDLGDKAADWLDENVVGAKARARRAELCEQK